MIYSLHSPKPNAVVSLIEILKFEDLQRHLLRNFLYLQVLRLLKPRHNGRRSFLTTIRPWKLEHEAKCVNAINSKLYTTIPQSYLHALLWKTDGRMISIDPQSIHRLINCPNPKV